MSMTEFQVWLAENMGFMLTGVAITSFCALAGRSVATSIALGWLAPTVASVKGLLNGLPEKHNMPAGGQYFNVGLSAGCFAGHH